MTFLTEYGLFLAKTVTFLLAIGAIILMIVSTRQPKARKGELVVTDLSSELEQGQFALKSALASKAERKQLRRDVQMVFQSPYASLNPRQKIGDQLAEPLLINTGLSRAERRERVQSMRQIVAAVNVSWLQAVEQFEIKIGIRFKRIYYIRI